MVKRVDVEHRAEDTLVPRTIERPAVLFDSGNLNDWKRRFWQYAVIRTVSRIAGRSETIGYTVAEAVMAETRM